MINIHSAERTFKTVKCNSKYDVYKCISYTILSVLVCVRLNDAQYVKCVSRRISMMIWFVLPYVLCSFDFLIAALR